MSNVQSVQLGEGLQTFIITEPLVVKRKYLFQEFNAFEYQKLENEEEKHLILFF